MAEMVQNPDIYLCIGPKLLDFTKMLNLEQCLTVMETEFLDNDDPEKEVFIIGSKVEISTKLI